MSAEETPRMKAVRYNTALSRAYKNLVTALPINNLIPNLISHHVLTGNLAEQMRVIAVPSEKTAFLLRSIKHNLDDGRIDQFEHFVQAVQDYAEDEDDIVTKHLLSDLKGNDPGDKHSSVPPHNEPAAVETAPNYTPPNQSQFPPSVHNKSSYPPSYPYNVPSAPMTTYSTNSPVPPLSYSSGVPPGMPTSYPTQPAPVEPTAPYNTGRPMSAYNNYPAPVTSTIYPPVPPYGSSAPTIPAGTYGTTNTVAPPASYNYMPSPYTYYPNQYGSQSGDYSRRGSVPPNQYNPPGSYQPDRRGSMPQTTYNNYPTQYAPPQTTAPYQPGGYDGKGAIPITTGIPAMTTTYGTNQARTTNGDTKVSQSFVHHQLVDAYRKAITRYYQQLVTLLPIEDMMEDLMKGKIISHRQQVIIDSKHARADKTQIILDKLFHSLSSGILESTENFLIVIENYGKRENDSAIVHLVKEIRGDAHSQGVKSKNFTSHYDAVSCRVALEKSRSELIALLPMKKLLPDLYAHEVVSMHLKDELTAMSSPQQQAKVVINTLQTALSVGVTSGFERFLHAIQEYARREHDQDISQLVESIFNDIKQE